MELDYFRYFLCYQVDTGDAAGNGRCVNGVGVGDTVEIWFFGGLSVGYRNLAERLKLSCPFRNISTREAGQCPGARKVMLLVVCSVVTARV